MNILKKIYNLLPPHLAKPLRYIIEYVLYKTGIHKNPGHSLKQYIIKKLQKKYKIDVFIETGTYQGDMLEAQKNTFKSLYSIELSKKYYNLAKERFSNRKEINLILGDSAEKLNHLLGKIKSRSIIFLDGHFSGGETAKGHKECPLLEEINAFINNKSQINNHILIIDDARLCGVDKAYPTISELKERILKINKDYKIIIKNDQIIAYF